MLSSDRMSSKKLMVRSVHKVAGNTKVHIMYNILMIGKIMIFFNSKVLEVSDVAPFAVVM